MFSFDAQRHHFDDRDAPRFQMGEPDLAHGQRQLSDRVPPYKGDFDPSDPESQFADLGLSQAQAMG